MNYQRYIGINNLTFDGDSEFIENLVGYQNGDKSDILIDIIYHTYMEKLISYYSKYQQFYNSSLNTHNDKIEALQSEVDNGIKIISKTYEDNLTIDNVFITKTFFKLGSMVSHIKGFEVYGTCENCVSSNMYVLANDTGYHSYNSYLYALINNVIILGIPNQGTAYDQFQADEIDACPANFFLHDLNHILKMEKNGVLTPENLKDLSTLQKYILTEDFNKNTKEILIFTIWYISHEYYKSIKKCFKGKYYNYDLMWLFDFDNADYSIEYGIDVDQNILSTLSKDELLKLDKKHNNANDHYDCVFNGKVCEHDRCYRWEINSMINMNILSYGFKMLKEICIKLSL